jgi:hypothetical protein
MTGSNYEVSYSFYQIYRFIVKTGTGRFTACLSGITKGDLEEQHADGKQGEKDVADFKCR